MEWWLVLTWIDMRQAYVAIAETRTGMWRCAENNVLNRFQNG